MPIGLAAATAIGAGLATGGNIFSSISGRKAQREANQANIAAQERINAQNIAFTRENNALARQWALEDWQRTNAWNSPVQQMQRLKEAGLNPHMVYGGGTATNLSSMVKSTTPNNPSLSAPQQSALPPIDLGTQNLQNTFMSATLAKQELENKAAQNALLQQQLVKGDLDIAGKTISNKSSEFSLTQRQALNDTAIQSARQRLEQMQADTERTRLQTKQMPYELEVKQAQLALQSARNRADIASITASTLKQIFETAHILPEQKRKLKAEVDNARRTGQLQQYDINLRAKGLNPSDPAYARILVQIAEQLAKKYGVELPME